MQFFWGGALISCSNGSSSSDEDDDESSYGTKIYSESVTFSETPTQIVSAETLADLSIKSLTIKVINVNYSGSDDWWFTACSDSSWSNEAKLEWQSGEGTNSLYLATITDAAAIAAYKANGIYISGTDSATAAVSVFYVEGEAEESNASSGSDSQTENTTTSNETSSSENETTGTSSNENEDNGSSSEEALIESFSSNTRSANFTISSSYQLLMKYETVNSASKVTITISDVQTGTSNGDWWFASGTDSSKWKADIAWKEGNYYELEISDISEYSKGIYLGGLEGLSGTVTVSYE
ncbi:MAG: hypothetical protein PUI64_08935 [Treponema succinifaciens]|uniref:hypothetical protein n=1 Tax=Treponema succinifaciens TaxID=167 RepID=UPI0023F55C24|nr:hypothetical protein [Treponema succinifaciens]MDD6963003.1 hypothetical protein [Treponema succinifaciens]MDY5117886.1 hypothetical protein [Treponema succinifaciens]